MATVIGLRRMYQTRGGDQGGTEAWTPPANETAVTMRAHGSDASLPAYLPPSSDCFSAASVVEYSFSTAACEASSLSSGGGSLFG